MVNTEPKHDMRLAVTHETSSDEAEAQITSWLKSFEDVEFVKKRSHMWDTVFVSTDSAEDALDSVMASEIGADSAPEKVKVSIIDFSSASESMGVATEPELIVKPIGATKIEGNVDSYIDDALELFEGSLAMPDAEPSAESIANAKAKSESEDEGSRDESSQYPLYGEMKNSASSDLRDTLSEFENTGRHRRVEVEDDGDNEPSSDEADADVQSNSATSGEVDNEQTSSETVAESSASDEERPRLKLADLQRKVNEEAQRIRAEEETSDAASEYADFADSSREGTKNHSDFADSRASSLNLTFDESDVPEFAESSEIDSKSDLERGDRLTFALDSIMPHSKNDVLSSAVGFDDARLSQLSPQSRLSLEMAIKQANGFLDNSRVDAAAESESVTNEELRDEIFSAISHFSDNSDESVDAYADAYAEAVSFANAIQVASDEIVEEYNAREDAWVAKQIDALREIYRQNNPDRTDEAIDALIEKNTPKYAELEAAADAVRPAAVAAVVRFLRKKNTKTSDAASELTRFAESRNVASAQLEENFRTLQGIDASNGFEVPNEPEPREETSQNESDVKSEQRSDDTVNLVPASELGLSDDKDAKSDSDQGEATEKTDGEIADDVALSPAVSALADDESDEDKAENEKVDETDADKCEQVSESDGDVDSEKTDDDSIAGMKLDESLKNDDDNTGEVSDFDEEEAAELPQDFMDDDADVEKDEKQAPSKKVIAIAAACTVGLIGAGTLFTGFVWPGFFKSDETAVSQEEGAEESMALPSGDAEAGADEEQEPSDASGLYRMGDTIRVVTRGEIQNLTIAEFTPGGGAVAENSAGDKFRITQTQLDNYANENQEQFEGRETLTDQAPADSGDQQKDDQNEQKPDAGNAPGGEPVVDENQAEQGEGEAQ